MSITLSKDRISIGSAEHCDLRLLGPGVASEHGHIVHHGNGNLVFVDGGQGPTTVDGRALAPKAEAVFDFRAQFVLGQTPLPLTHPAIATMLMRRGDKPVDPNQLSFGRDSARAHIVIQHPNISGLHATVTLNPLSIVDHGSTSGTWLDRQRIPKDALQSLAPGAVIALGPIPISAALIRDLAPHAPAAQPMAPASVQAGALHPPAAPASGTPAGSSGPRKHKTVVGQISMAMSAAPEAKTIGRTAKNDIQVEHPQVSSKHALLHKLGDQLFIEDLGSANGTYVRGQRIAAHERVKVSAGEKIFIGPMPLLLQGKAVPGETGAEEVHVVVEDSESWAGKPLYEIEAWDLVLQVPDRDNPSELKTLLDHVSFKAMPGDFIALMGPSGAGKTTLLLTLNGYLPPSAGQVRINGEDLYSIYDALRGSIGYVPQDDIVHPELTVWEAVRYSARFRLPPDYSDEEIDRRVSTTLQQLGLETVAHLQIGKPEKKVLSGGQRKRVNIAMELVTDPVIMFLDEPTSGLAADDTSALVHLLSNLAKATGKTIITTIHQPAKAEFEKFNLALIMGQGGIPIYYGPTHPDAYRFFGNFAAQQGKPNAVDNPRDMFDMLQQREKQIFDQLRTQDANAPRAQARQLAARQWHEEYFRPDNPVFQKMFSGTRAVGAGTGAQGVPQGRSSVSGQFGLLFSRYLKIKMRDVAGTAIMLLQAPIIGVLLAMVFGGQKEAIPFWCLGALQELSGRAGGLKEAQNDLLQGMSATPDHAGAIFFLVVSAVWFGTSNAAREIVSERAIYLRERMVNLTLPNYLFSKFLLLSVFTIIQCTVLQAIVFFALGFNGGIVAFAISLATLCMTGINSCALGLLLSTVVVSGEAAMALTPIALIPQVVLGGLMVPMTTNPMLEWPMYAMPARWGFQGVVAQERIAIANNPAWIMDLHRTETSVDNFVTAGKFHCAEAQIAATNFNGAWGFTNYQQAWLPPAILASMMLGLLLVILVILKRRDPV
jgi:ABC-type multidrug transport system ATPase subunit/pSer/pThr/pTyr-binding forkhead associated (FHA) protein